MARKHVRHHTSQVRLPPRLLRGVEGAFWFVLALAVAWGGKGAWVGFSELGRVFSPAVLTTASAHGDLPVPTERKAAAIARPPTMPPAAKASSADISAPPSADTSSKPAVAIVIDDLGMSPTAARRAMALPGAVALSFLPYAEATPELARAASRAGHDVLAHVPMQAEADADPGLMALYVDLPPAELKRRLEWNLSRVPGFIGINNHMGSLFTENRAALSVVMPELKNRGVFFFDSVTTPHSLGVTTARRFGVESAGRDVFLDDTQSAAAVTAQLALLERIARTQGVATAIGHPHGVTLALLERWCAHHPAVRLVRIEDAIRMKTAHERGAVVEAATDK